MVERLFSAMNLMKTKLRNRMGTNLLNSILTIRNGLKRQKVCCDNYILPNDVLKMISMPREKNVSKEVTDEDAVMDIDNDLGSDFL